MCRSSNSSYIMTGSSLIIATMLFTILRVHLDLLIWHGIPGTATYYVDACYGTFLWLLHFIANQVLLINFNRQQIMQCTECFT